MPTRCQDCSTSFLLSNADVISGVACPECGGTRLERDQPSPTTSDGELRDMVDPGTNLDHGGNPLQEGIWAGVDGGWQPAFKRDESFASVRTAGMMDMLPHHSPPMHSVTATPNGPIHNGTMQPLFFLDAAINGLRVRDPQQWQEIYSRWGNPQSPEYQTPVQVSVHHPDHLPAAQQIVENAGGMMGQSKATMALAPAYKELGQAVMTGQRPDLAPPGLPGFVEHGNITSAVRHISQDDWGFDFNENEPAAQSHHFIIDNGNVYTHPENPTAHHDEIAAAHGLQGFPRGMSLGRYDDDGSTEFYQHESPHDVNQMAQMLGNHFGNQVMVDPNLKPTTNEERWFGEGANEQTLDRMQQKTRDNQLEDYQLDLQPGRRQEMQRAIKERGKPFGYYDNPYINRGGSFRHALSQEPYMPWTHESGDRFAFLPLLAEGAEALGGRFLLGQAAGGLLRGAFHGFGNNQPEQPVNQDAYQGPPNIARTADMETPLSVPEMHDNPDGDTQQFNDGDLAPSFQNPGLQDSGASGEDGVRNDLGLRLDDNTLTDVQNNLPKLLEYYHSDKSGLQDPLLRALHEKIEQAQPGYLGRIPEDNTHVDQLLGQLRHGTSASVRQALTPMMGPSLPPNAMGQTPFQTQGELPGNMPSQGKCANCGGTLNADGTCPQCGFNNQGQVPGQGGNLNTQMGMGNQPGVQPWRSAAEQYPSNDLQGMQASPCPSCKGVVGNNYCPRCHGSGYLRFGEGSNSPENIEGWPNSYKQWGPGEKTLVDMENAGKLPANNYQGKVAADHQGPITDEQKSAVAQLLIQQGRAEEIPTMLTHPDQYIDLLQQVTQQTDTVPPSVDPNEQPPPMPMPQGPNPNMPMPGMSAPGQGGPMMSHVAADSYTPRCPKCNSATTGLIDEDGNCRCHSCNNIFKRDVVKDNITSRVWKVAFDPGQMGQEKHHHPQNPDALPAADQDVPEENLADTSMTWQDTSGQPLEVGGEYEMHSSQWAIPDVVRIETVKPDGLTISEVGQYDPANADPTQPQVSPIHDLSKEEAEVQGLTFVPTSGGEDESAVGSGGNNIQDGPGQTQNTQPVHTPDFNPGIRSHVENLCPACNYSHFASMMTSPVSTQNECYRCGNIWNNYDVQDDITDNEDSRVWLNESEDLFVPDARAMAMASSGKSRNVRDIAERDSKLQRTKQILNANSKTAGKKFTLKEQRDFIDEEGIARNSDRLDLDGTHYVSNPAHLIGARPDKVNENYIGFY